MMAVLDAERKPISKLQPMGIEEPEPYTSEEFTALAASYPDLRMELTREGEFVIMPPAGGETGSRNADLTADLVVWNRIEKTGKVFDSLTGFVLSNGAKRSPDAFWVPAAEWEALSSEGRQQFLPLCPSFVIELRSRTDRLSTVQENMCEYRDNGARLGWLLDPKSKRVEIYRPGRDIEIIPDDALLIPAGSKLGIRIGAGTRVRQKCYETVDRNAKFGYTVKRSVSAHAHRLPWSG